MLLSALALQASAIEGVQLHGSIQSDILFPDGKINNNGTEIDDKVLTNTYADLGLTSRYVDAGLRFEYLQHPLPIFVEPDFKGWGVPYFYVKGKYKGLELTAGDVYEQFGSGLILRTYEDRAVGIDNAIRGGRLKVNCLDGLRFTVLGGLQRRYFDWPDRSVLGGADLEFDINSYSSALRDRNITWTIGGSYVIKHEKDEDILVPGSNYRLNLPLNVNAFDVRTQFYRNSFNLLGEFAWKNNDPSVKNHYIYKTGTAYLLSASYSRSGWSAFVQAKRSENMSFRSQRAENGMASFVNYMPPFAYQHTYTLASMYPYATQYETGEWAFQAAGVYTFKRHTPLGGKYGTKLRLNVSYIRSLKEKDGGKAADATLKVPNTTYGTDGPKTEFFGMGALNYADINLQMEKRIVRDFNLNLMYMYQKYNNAVLSTEESEEHEDPIGMINSHIFVAEGKWKINKRNTLRAEAQYLTTRQAKKDWVFGLLEYSLAPYLMFSVSDQWNCGKTKEHYYMFNVTGNYKNNRLMLGYGRTREVFNCSGGVCRFVPESKGFQISYNYNF